MADFTVYTHDEREYPCTGKSQYRVLEGGVLQVDRDAEDSLASRILFGPDHWLRVEDRDPPKGGLVA
jgi:hypothetical protein